MFNPPRQARIPDVKFARFAPALARMGLPRQEFRLIGEGQGVVFVHPEDLSPLAGEALPIRRDIVEIVGDESET